MTTRSRTKVALLLAGLLLAGQSARGAFVTPTGVTASSTHSSTDVNDLINSDGLSVNTAAGTHDNQSSAQTM